MSSPVSAKSHDQLPASEKTSFWQPSGMTDERNSGQIPFDSISRSYFLIRTFVGICGLALPAILLIGERWLDDAEIATRGSLSAYYHSGVRDIFVSILAVVGILLFTYKITERNRDNSLSIIAGVAAIGVAIFPTGIPSVVDARLTPLQNRLGEDRTEFIHFTCAFVFVVSLGVLCWDFANRERKRSQKRDGHDAQLPPTLWYSFHLTMAIAILCAVVFIGLTQWLGFFDQHSILIGETVVTVAFGLSWLLKGLDLKVLPRMTNW